MLKFLPDISVASQFFSLILLCFLLLPSPAISKEFRVCSVEIPGGLKAEDPTDGTGGVLDDSQPFIALYNEIIKEVSAKTGHSFSLVISPAARCARMFARKEVDIAWPFIINSDPERIKEWGYPYLPVYSMPIIMGGYYIFTRDDEPIINTVAGLEGKQAVHAIGYGIPVSYEKNDKIRKQAVPENELIPKMIKTGRVDAGILQTGWVPELKRSGMLKGLHHGAAIDFWGGGFTFHPNEEGISLANTFSNEILKLVVRGKYQEIMTGAPYYIPDY